MIATGAHLRDSRRQARRKPIAQSLRKIRSAQPKGEGARETEASVGALFAAESAQQWSDGAMDETPRCASF